MKNNKIQLITYPDSLGNNLKDLYYVLDKYLRNYIGGVHILPFFPSSADRGFAPLTYFEVDPKFGNWDDVKRISKDFDLMVDFIMNHISLNSIYFQDFIRKGYDSEYADMFLTLDKVFSGENDENIKKIYRRKVGEPFIKVHLPNGEEKKVWVTFSPDQIDFDWKSSKTRELMKSFLAKIRESGIKFVRLDAVGYTSKKSGSDCFFEKDVFDNIDFVHECLGPKISLLPEVHSHYKYQLELAKKCDFTYDFQISILMLHAIYFSTAEKLKNWINIRPENVVSALDTHDGIGIVDGEGLLSEEELESTKKILFEKGGNSTMIASGENSENVDVYQVNCTYYSALNDDDSYLLARAIQFFLPGIPQVYYVGLFAGKNDLDLLKRTGVGRDINRHYYSLDEIESSFSKSVVKKLMNLMKFRNNYLAFNGEFKMEESGDDKLILRWNFSGYECVLDANLLTKKILIKYTEFEQGELIWKKLEGIGSEIEVKDFNHKF